MGGIEKTIETFKDTLLAKTGGILKAFFDHDILDEEVIIEWGKKVHNITFLFVVMTGLKTEYFARNMKLDILMQTSKIGYQYPHSGRYGHKNETPISQNFVFIIYVVTVMYYDMSKEF